ncbi:zinc finger CCCH domain-containing protein 13-like [Xyrauchen texanus]|uniref:zinc finger CCCH domain-containing protein 13-like n=1 Tax=Xyrauchen texanus TaxID=154827 RepID=UPI00224236E1|nr:zinc finger CCCH domain-containing protein 13-like [Xyrauchen texanus]
MDKVWERPRDREREIEPDSYDRTRERKRLPATRGGRDGEMNSRERERKRDGERHPNGRASFSEQGEHDARENERKKGDTFPRTTRPSKEREGRVTLPDHDRELRMGRLKEVLYESERERDRERERRRYRDMDMQNERKIAKYREELRRNEMRKLVKKEPNRQRNIQKEFDLGIKERRRESYPGVNDHWYVWERERDRLRQKEREGRSDPRLMDRRTEGFSDRERRAERQREGQRNRQRDTKSEGYSDGEREKERRREEDSKLRHKHYKSEGDSETERKDRFREREAERRRDMVMPRERETGYRDLRGERWERYRDPERMRDRDIEKRTERHRYRMRKEEITMEKRKDYPDRDAYLNITERRRYKEGERMRERDRFWEKERDRRRRANRETERSNMEKNRQNSGEQILGSDAENEQRRGKRENFKDKDRENASKIDKEKLTKGEEEVRTTQREEEGREKVAAEETEIEKSKNKLRKMWLEPRTENERKKSSLEEEYAEREKARERYIQRYKTARDEEEPKREKEREKMSQEDWYREPDKAGEFMRVVNAEREERLRGDMACDREALEPERQIDGGNVADNVEENDREEEERSNRYGCLKNEEGSEGESEEEKNRIIPADDGFVTVSSGGDDAEEDDFDDCKEFWDGGASNDLSGQSKSIEDLEVRRDKENQTENEREDRRGHKESVKVFCVISQTLPKSPAKRDANADHIQHSDHDMDNQCEVNTSDGNEASKNYGSTKHNIERVMDDLTLHNEDKGNHDTTVKGTGSNDQAIKDVSSLEGKITPPNQTSEKDSEPLPPELLETTESCKDSGYVASQIESPLQETEKEAEYFSLDDTWSASEERKQCSTLPHLRWAKKVVKEILGRKSWEGVTVDTENTRGSVPHIDVKINTQTEGETEMDEPREEKGLIEEGEWGGMKRESNEESEHDLLDPSSVQQVLSSEGEADREEEVHVDEKKDRKPEAVLSSSSFQDFGNEARIRRREFQKTTDKHKEEKEEEEEGGGGVGRDRRTRIFNISDEDEDEFWFSWGEGGLRKMTRKNSKFFNSQLYQEYSEVVQNREILLSHSDSIGLSDDHSAIRSSSSPNHSPKLSHRPLPTLPPVPLHPPQLSQNNSFKSLAVPQQAVNRPPSPRLSISAFSPTLWQDLPGVRTSSELETVTKDDRRLQEVRFEVVTSEASYCRSLDIVVEHFVMSKQLNVLLTSQDKNWLFSRLIDVRAVSHSFLSHLEEKVESDIMHFTVCDIINKHCPRFRKVYVPYLTNQSYQDKTYQRLMDGSHEFRRVVEKLELNPVCQRLPLRSFLILPFQRITRLKLLVQNIVKRTDSKTNDEAQAIKAMKLLEKMIQDSNESISQMKNIESLVSLNAKVDFECRTLPLISQSRRLVREGPVTELRDFSLKETERSVYMHLFNDYLLLSLWKDGCRFTVIDHAPISELRVENCRFKLHSLKKNLFRLYMGPKAVLLRTDTQADKLRWISALSRPYPEIDFSAVEDFVQMQCIRAFVAQQPDELSLEKADVLLVHKQSTDGWVEATRLSDRQRGWAPESHLETIVSGKARKRNLLDTMKIATAAM